MEKFKEVHQIVFRFSITMGSIFLFYLILLPIIALAGGGLVFGLLWFIAGYIYIVIGIIVLILGLISMIIILIKYPDKKKLIKFWLVPIIIGAIIILIELFIITDFNKNFWL